MNDQSKMSPPPISKASANAISSPALGLWALAIRWAGYEHVDGLWTGSCPCQPFSAAGKGEGFNDERHLWPAWFWLIRQSRPAIVLGEQVTGEAGRTWLDLVSDDLEGIGYTFGAANLPACSVGAPHIRARHWFVADANSQRRNGKQVRVQPGKSRQDRVEATGRRRTNVWTDVQVIRGDDGIRRPIERGLVTMAVRYPGSVGRIRAYGNAIVPQVAQAFIETVMEYHK